MDTIRPYNWNDDADHLLHEKRRELLAELCANLRDACDQLHELLVLPPTPVLEPATEREGHR